MGMERGRGYRVLLRLDFFYLYSWRWDLDFGEGVGRVFVIVF